MNDFVFLVFGLGFFLYVFIVIERSNDKQYERRLNEMREFGLHQEEQKKRFGKKPQ